MNKSLIHKLSLVTIGLVVLFFTFSCDRMAVGYLQTNNAEFSPDTVYAYRNLDPKDERVLNNIPFTSLRIQGVAGTNPINYEFESVKANDGGSETAFVKAVESGDIIVRGGVIQLFHTGVAKISNGSYTLSIKVYNEGYSEILEDIFTFVVQDNEL